MAVASFTLPPEYTISDPRMPVGTGPKVHVRYTELHSKDPKGNDIYSTTEIRFEKGRMVVSDADLFFYLDNAPWNRDNCKNYKGVSSKIFLFDPKKIADANLDREMLIAEAMEPIVGKTTALPIDQLKELAWALEIPSVDSMSESEVKSSLISIAKTTPELIIDNINSDSVKVKAMVKQALDRAIMKWDQRTNAFYWNTEEKGEIMTVPKGHDATNFFVRWLVKTDTTEVLSTLEEELKGEKSEKSEKVA